MVVTMASQGGGGAGGRYQPQVQTFAARQDSFYSLTLNEVQNHLGEPLRSMNLEELIRNVLPGGATGVDAGRGSSVSKKTVDEVWKDIQQQNEGNDERNTSHGRHATLGEMTLEDFLVKAGVAGDKRQWIQQQYHHHHHNQDLVGSYAPSTAALVPGSIPILDPVYGDGRGSLQTTALMGSLSDPQITGRKRMSSEGQAEKSVERRQKRMIKNRESAARSRARKQAYTNELENKVSRLEEENERLKKQKALDTILHSAPTPETKYQLRRTTSAPL